MAQRPKKPSAANLRRMSRRGKGNLSWTGNELADSYEGMRRRYKEWARQLLTYQESVEELRVFYERYFRGGARREPLRERQELERNLRRMALPEGAPASIKFRYASLMARLNLLRAYWDRTLRRIEDGTFRKDLRYGAGPPARPVAPLTDNELVPTVPQARPEPAAVAHQEPTPAAQRPAAPQPAATPTAMPAAMGSPAPPPAVRPARPTAVPTDAPYARVYSEYVRAQQATGAKKGPPSYAAFARSLDKQKAVQSERHGTTDVDFVVRTDEGRVRVVAKLKRKRTS